MNERYNGADHGTVIGGYIGIGIFCVVVSLVGIALIAIDQAWSMFGGIVLIVIAFVLFFRVIQERRHAQWIEVQHEERQNMEAQHRYLPKPESPQLPQLPAAPVGEMQSLNPGGKEMFRYSRDEVERAASKAARLLLPSGRDPSQGNISAVTGYSGGGMANAVQIVLKEWGYIENEGQNKPYKWTQIALVRARGGAREVTPPPTTPPAQEVLENKQR